MKRIPMRVLPDERIPPSSPDYQANVLDWAEAMRQIIRRPLNQQNGAGIDEMRRGIRVLDAIDGVDSDILELEDADYDHLREKTLAMSWAFVDRRVLRFVEDVLHASDSPLINESQRNGLELGAN